LILAGLNKGRVLHLGGSKNGVDLFGGEAQLRGFGMRLCARQALSIKKAPHLAQAPTPVLRVLRQERVKCGVGRKSGFESVEHAKY
jgi:hypothetical protein